MTKQQNPKKTLVLGLGNPLLTDDSIGLHVAQKIRTQWTERPDIEVDEASTGGLQLMERLIGYDRAIIVDAIRTGAAPGTIHHLAPDAIPTQHSASSHDANLATALTLGRQAGAPLPTNDNILLIAIEAADVTTFSETCTPQVTSAIPQAIEAVLTALEHTPQTP